MSFAVKFQVLSNIWYFIFNKQKKHELSITCSNDLRSKNWLRRHEVESLNLTSTKVGLLGECPKYHGHTSFFYFTFTFS